MCDDLTKAMEISKEYGGKIPKGVEVLFKAAAQSVDKMNNTVKKYMSGVDERLDRMENDIRALTASFEEYKTDATKYRLIVELAKAMFGTTRRAVMTLVWFAVFVGLVHIKDVIELLKMMV